MARAKNSKNCMKCGRILPISDFYSNKFWKEQSYHDAWCRECYSRYCKDEESVKEYFEANNRKYDPALWEASEGRAEYNLCSNESYLKASHDERRRMLTEAAARILPSMFNLNRYYNYVDYVNTPDIFEKERQADIAKKSERLNYSALWRGYFTDEQIQTLDAMYQEYETDFDLSSVNRRDYVRKVIKASLNADIAEDKMRRGQITVQEYEKAQKVFDDLSKSSSLADCARKPGSATGLSSLGNIILGLQLNHHLDYNPFTFPPDDVDKIYNDYAHLATAVGAQL